MKRLYLYLSIIIAITSFVACSDYEGTIYDASSEANVSFFASRMNTEIGDDNKINVPIYRGNPNGNLDVEIEIEGDEVFSLENETISFADGETKVNAVLTFNKNDIAPITKYSITLSLSDYSQVSPSLVGSISITAQKALNWEYLGIGLYSDDLFQESWEQVVEKSGNNIYRLPDCIYTSFHIIFSLNDDKTLAYFPPQATGYIDADYGMLYYIVLEPETDFWMEDNVAHFIFTPSIAIDGKYYKYYEAVECTFKFPTE